MSSTGIATAPQVTDYDGEKRKTCARVDIAKVNQVNDVTIGDEVVLVIKGRVNSMRGPEERLQKHYKTGKEHTVVHAGSIEIEISNMEIGSVGEFDGLWKDED